MHNDQNTTIPNDGSPAQSQFDNSPTNSSNPTNPADAQAINSTTTPTFDNTAASTISSESQNEVSSLPTNSDFSNTSQAQNTQQSVVTAPHAPKKYGGKKVIATIFGILFLIGAIASGVFLVQKQQDLRERAASGSACDQSPDCVLVDNAPNSGSKTVERTITFVDITDKDYHRFEPGENDDGCRKVNISGNTVNWERYGDGPNCKDVSNVQIWMGNEQPTNTPTLPPGETPTDTPGHKVTICHRNDSVTNPYVKIEVDQSAVDGEGNDDHTHHTGPVATSKEVAQDLKNKGQFWGDIIPNNLNWPEGEAIFNNNCSYTEFPQTTASCSNVKAYDTNWNLFSQAQLSQIEVGTTIKFTVSGTASSGSFDKARFSVNSISLGETTLKKPGTDEFYIEYTMPEGITSFNVDAQVYHSELGWF